MDRKLVVLAAAVPWNGTTMLDQHVARELARYADVLYLDPATSALTRFRNPAAAAAARGPWLEPVGGGVTVARPRVNPLMERPVGKGLATALTRLTMRRAVRRLGRPVHAVVLTSLNPLFGVVGEAHRVFYASDDLVAGAGLMGVTDLGLAARARELPRSADVVAAVSPRLVEGLRADGVEALLVPNGVDVAHFAAAPRTVPDRSVLAGVPEGARVAGFVGIVGDRLDVGLLEAVADRGVHLVLVGPRQRTAAQGRLDVLLTRPEVHHVGPREYADLPAVLAAAPVWLLPYGDSEFNRASFPLKTLEYLAAGRRVVATDLPAVRWLDTDLVAVAAAPREYADAVVRELARPVAPDEAARRAEFAARHGWRERIEPLARRLALMDTESAAHAAVGEGR